jgi:hypothetical protein
MVMISLLDLAVVYGPRGAALYPRTGWRRRKLPAHTRNFSATALHVPPGALLRDDTAHVEPDLARLLAVPAERLAQQTGLAAYDFLLAATGRRDPAPLWLPKSVNIFR